MVLIRTSSSEEDDGQEGSRAALAVETPARGSGVAVLAGQRVKDDDPTPPPAREGLQALSACIVELLSMVTALVGQLGKEEPVEGAVNWGQRTSDSAVTADQGRVSSLAKSDLPRKARLGGPSFAQRLPFLN
ncbi:unnamed protein product [Lampetra planeri]